MIRKAITLLLLLLVVGIHISAEEPIPNASRPIYEKVTIANSIDSVPFHFNDEEGRPVGMLVDLWKLWSEKTGIEIEFKSSAWPGTLKMVRDGEADIHAGCFYSEERDKYLDYATTLRSCDTHFFFHESIFGLKTLDDLIWLKIGVIEKDSAVDYLNRDLPGATLAEYPSNEALFDAVERGEIKVFVYDTPAVLYYLAQRGLTHKFHHHFDQPLYTSNFYAAVRKGNSALVEVINNGMQMITAEERAEIERKWMGASEIKTKDVLVIACAMGYPPFTMLNSEGKPAGLFVDLWRLWAEKTGEKIEFRVSEWADTLNALRDGSADFHSGLYRTEVRSDWIDFSKPIYETRSSLFYHVDQGKISGLDELEGQKVGALRGAYASTYLRENWPDIEVVDFETSEASIIAAGEGQISAFLEEIPTALALLNHLGRVAEFKYLKEPLYSKKIHAGVGKDNPDLMNKINAGLSAITKEEMVEMESSWVSVPNNGIDPAVLWRLGLRISGVAAVILVVVLLWNMHIRGLKERFRGLTEHGMDITQAFTESGKIVYQSPSHTTVLGYEPKELLGKSVLDLFHKDDRARWENVLNSLLSGEGVQFFGHRFRNKQGSYQYFESNCINLLDNKALKAIVINARDVTERKQAEEARRENEEKLQTITASAQDAIIMMDDIGSISYWNEAAVEIFGYTKEEAIGQELHKFIAPERYYEDHKKGFSKFRKTGAGDVVGKTLELVGVRKGGMEFPLDLSLSSVCVRNKWNAIGILRDITERKQMEMHLMQSEKMASLGMLVAGVAHEINTPIGAINSMHNTLVRAIERLKSALNTIVTEESDGRQKVDRMFEVIEDANNVITSGTERVISIVRRLRSFARLDEAELKQVDIHEGIEDTLTMVHHELKNRIVVERNFGDIPPIFCYPSQLNQVYLNLLINAIHAIEDKGTITITTFQQDDHVHIQFKDTGIGIPEEALKRLFVPGYTTKDRGVGTGLGLSICHQIVKGHNGDILVESDVGKGTTFTVVLPLRVT